MLRKASETLKEVVEQLGIGSKISQARAIVYWDEVVGKKIAAHTEPYLVRGGTLFVSTTSPTWSQELSLIQPRLLKKINQRLGGAVIKEIRFQSRGLSERKESPQLEEEPDLSKIRLTPREKTKIEKQVRELPEKSLQEELRTVLIRDKQLKKWRLGQGWRKCRKCGAVVPPGSGKCPSCGSLVGKISPEKAKI